MNGFERAAGTPIDTIRSHKKRDAKRVVDGNKKHPFGPESGIWGRFCTSVFLAGRIFPKSHKFAKRRFFHDALVDLFFVYILRISSFRPPAVSRAPYYVLHTRQSSKADPLDRRFLIYFIPIYFYRD